jgi:HTH-type transcriptional regulator, bacterioopsin transcriptional activator and related proteins
MPPSSSETIYEETLAVFDEQASPFEPLTTPEIADALDCERRTAYHRLDTLVDRGEVETKKVGSGARVWWRQPAEQTPTVSRGTAERKHAKAERDLLYKTTRSIAQSATFDEGLQTAVQDLCEATDWAYAEAWIPTEGGELRRAEADYYTDDLAEFAELSEGYTFAHGEGLPGRVWASGEFEWIAHLASGTRGEFLRLDEALSVGLKSTLGVPVGTDDEVVAVLTFFMRERRAIDDRLVNQVSSVAAELGDLLTHQRIKQRLKRERDLVERVLETIPVGVGVLSSHEEIVRMNKRAAEILGIVDDDPEADAYAAGDRRIYDPEGDSVPPQDRPYAQVFETGEPVLDWQCQIENPDGERRWLSVNAAPLTDEDGEVEWVVTSGEDITQLKEQARRLERQRDDLKTELDEVFDLVSDGFFGLDAQLRFIHVNDRAADLVDKSAGDLVGERIWDAFEPRPKAKAAFDEAMETQEPAAFEEYYEPLDTWFENHVYPSESGMSVYFRDVTERKRRERDLEESKNRYQALVENFPNGIVTLFDDDFRHQIAGGELFDEFGTSPEDVVGRTIYERNAPEDVALLEPAYEAAMNGDSSTFETEYAGRIVEIRTVPVPDETGTVFAGMAMSQDITDRKRREQDLERYERIVETVRDGVYALDPDDRFILVNQAFCDLVGYDRETLLGAHPTLINSQVVNDTANILQAGERDVGVAEAEFETATGKTVPVEGKTALFEYADGRFSRCGVVRDITEQLRREEEFVALNRLNKVFQEVTNAIIESSSREEIEQTITEHLTNSDSYEYAWIGHLDRHGEKIIPQIDDTNEADLSEIPLSSANDDPTSHPPAAEAIRTGEVQVTYDNTADPVLGQWKRSQDIHHQVKISIPITYEERVYGVLNVYTARENAFDENERRIIRRLSEVVGHAINAIERKRALLENCAQEITFKSHRFAEIFTEAADDESFTISIEKFVALPDDRSIAYYSLDGLDPAVFIDVIEQYNPNAEYHVTDKEGSQARVEVQQSNLTLATELATYNSWITDGTLQNGEFRIKVQVPQHSHIREVIDVVKEAYPDVEVLAQTEIERESARLRNVFSDLDDQLTERQRTTLEVAYYSGYFDWPRAITGEELAERLDVTPGTVSHHLRHGEHKVLSAFFDFAE